MVERVFEVLSERVSGPRLMSIALVASLGAWAVLAMLALAMGGLF